METKQFKYKTAFLWYGLIFSSSFLFAGLLIKDGLVKTFFIMVALCLYAAAFLRFFTETVEVSEVGLRKKSAIVETFIPWEDISTIDMVGGRWPAGGVIIRAKNDKKIRVGFILEKYEEFSRLLHDKVKGVTFSS